MAAHAKPPRESQGRVQEIPALRWQERWLGVAMAGISGAALLLHAWAKLPMSFTISFAAMPVSLLLVAMALRRRRLTGRLHRLADLTLLGGSWGLAGTLVYDLVRPLLKWILGYKFNAFGAIPIFGHLITGLPLSDAHAVAAGWAYHFWNGISFGMIFAYVRPRGGLLPGMCWGMALQVLIMAVYPQLLAIRLTDPGFLISGIIGHGVWGGVLGVGLRRS